MVVDVDTSITQHPYPTSRIPDLPGAKIGNSYQYTHPKTPICPPFAGPESSL